MKYATIATIGYNVAVIDGESNLGQAYKTSLYLFLNLFEWTLAVPLLHLTNGKNACMDSEWGLGGLDILRGKSQVDVGFLRHTGTDP